jgi:hypothetical protein
MLLNKHFKDGISEEEFVALRKERDAGLAEPKLLHQQRLVEQLGLCQSCITFLSQSHKLFFADTVFEMLVQTPCLG